MRRVFSTGTVLLASAVLAAAACLGLNGCALMDNRAATARPVATDLPGLQSVGLHQVWQRQVGLEPGERIRKVWREGLSVYVATTDSRIVRIDAKTGILKWSNGLGRENFEIYKPIELKDAAGFPSGEVLVMTRGEAFIFDLNLGDELRMGRLGISVSADPVVIGNTLCVGGADTFYGLYLDSLGKKIYTDGGTKVIESRAMRRWVVPAPGDMFISAPLALDKTVLVGSKNGRLWRINAETGDWGWKDRKTNGLITGGLAADFNAAYVPCEDQRVYAFRMDTGAEKWDTQLEDRLEETPVLAGPAVLVVAVNRTLFALDRVTGLVKWKYKNVSQVATVNEDTVWIGDMGGNIRLLALETGEEQAAALTTGIEYFVRNSLDQNVVLVTQAGLVGMYSPASVNEK